MHDELYRNQLMLHRDALPAHAASVGLDLLQFSADLDDPTLTERVQRDVASGRRNHVRGTPTVFIDGIRQSAPLIADALRMAIAETAMRSTERMLRGEDDKLNG
jgi:predicted DsbA family dithiol-disulfide isomerase